METSQFVSLAFILAVILAVLVFIAARIHDIYKIVNDRISAD